LKQQFGRLPAVLPTVDLSDQPGWSTQPETNLDRAITGVNPNHLAYIIYTSGSAGIPKGAMIPHRGVCNQIAALQGQWRTCAQDRLLQFASVTFDASVEEIFGALLSGATLVLRSDDCLAGSQQFWHSVASAGITVVDLPTRFWGQVVQDRATQIPLSVRLVVIGGEAVDRKSLANWFAVDGYRPALWNSYGPTETTVNATLHPVSPNFLKWDCIGRPIGNTRAYILDARGEPVPLGVGGDLYIAGAGVARGYLNRLDLTAERFIADPFSQEAGGRMYQTGDIARFLPDGDIEFLGRKDFQVKIRGYRIELGEIEAQLGAREGIGEAVVTARADVEGEKRLVAYYIEREGWEGSVGAEELRAWMRQKLPEYMVPAAYVRIKEMPLTEGRKLDPTRLPAPGPDAYGVREYEEPVGETEQAVAAIWAEVLNVERIGRHDNFFALGGHSLLAMLTIARLRQRLGVEIGSDALFARPVLAPLAEWIIDQQLAAFDSDDLENALKLIEES
jgi:amino acid adenylation domain-containing protein